jgi:hypothetical protein
MDELWYSRSQVIAVLNVSSSTVWRLAVTGKIRTRAVGHRRYWAADVHRLATQFTECTFSVHGAKECSKPPQTL